MTITITTQIDISTATLGDVAITFAESGQIGFWRQLLTYDYTRWMPDDAPDNGTIEVDEDFVFYTIAYEHPTEERIARTDITPRLLAEGIGMALRSGAIHDPSDLAAMDAGEADLVVQYAIFGEEVYA